MSDVQIAEYTRFRWLVPGKLAGAPHPNLSDCLAAVAPFLRTQGVGAIITLYDTALVPSPEELGFRSLFVETPDFRPPPDLGRILSFIAAQLQDQRAVLVHCFAGIGRTGTVLAAWLLASDSTLSAAEAIAWVREGYIPEYARSRFPEHPTQVAALEQLEHTRRVR